MATLILEHDGRRRGAVLNGRTVIGRRANSHVVIPDRSVSRVHAWIGKAGHTYFVADSGSRTGTLVNGRPVDGRRSLRDGDRIGIGPATITFRAEATLPPDVEPLQGPAPAPVASDDGIFIYCGCDAPIWAPWEFGGRMGRCRHCGQTLELPCKPGGAGPSDPNNDTVGFGTPSPIARANIGSKLPGCTGSETDVKPPVLNGAPAPSAKSGGKPLRASRGAEADEGPRTETICGACQSSISAPERTATCPDCGVAFHADCWTENRGCSSYGCKQVGILDPKTAPNDDASQAQVAPDEQRDAGATSAWPSVLRAIPWNDVLLPASVLAALASLFAYGVPSLTIAIGLVVGSARNLPIERSRVMIAIVVSIAAGTVGSAFSTYWWLR